MSDDPRDILEAAGVECAEVDAWVRRIGVGSTRDMGDAAILPLAHLVAKYKWQRDFVLKEEHSRWYNESSIADLDLRWEEHDATR